MHFDMDMHIDANKYTTQVRRVHFCTGLWCDCHGKILSQLQPQWHVEWCLNVFKKLSIVTIVFSLFLMVSHGLFWGIDSWHENKIERLVTRHREYSWNTEIKADRSDQCRSDQCTSVMTCNGNVHRVASRCGPSCCEASIRTEFRLDDVSLDVKYVNGCKFLNCFWCYLMFCFFQDFHGISRSQEP
jgi:hypothetical protein